MFFLALPVLPNLKFSSPNQRQSQRSKKKEGKKQKITARKTLRDAVFPQSGAASRTFPRLFDELSVTVKVFPPSHPSSLLPHSRFHFCHSIEFKIHLSQMKLATFHPKLLSFTSFSSLLFLFHVSFFPLGSTRRAFHPFPQAKTTFQLNFQCAIHSLLLPSRSFPSFAFNFILPLITVCSTHLGNVCSCWCQHGQPLLDDQG